MRPIKITLSLSLVVVTLLYLGTVQSLNIGEYLREKKNNLVSAIRDGIIGSSSSMMAFNQTMHKIRTRYDEAVEKGELDGKDQAEHSSFYYKIVIEEIRTLKKELLPEEAANVDAKIEELANSCKKCSDEARASMTESLSMDEDEEENADQLKNELDDTENMERVLQLEAEMGWSIDPETKKALKTRTLNLLSELLQNEIKTLVVVMIKAYFLDSTPPGAVAAVMGAIDSGLKVKVGEYLMSSVMEIFSNFFKTQALETVPV